MIAIIDYGMGNVQSVKNAMSHIGVECILTANPEEIQEAGAILLPGVGAFADAMRNLKEKNLIDVLNKEVIDNKKPILGICLGMQLLFESSEEGGTTKGLGWIPGKVEYIDAPSEYRVPHIGWNDLELTDYGQSAFFGFLGDDKDYYFVHSYYANCSDEYVLARCDHGKKITAAVKRDNIIGMQYHPEKSQKNGLLALEKFVELIGVGNA